MRKGAVAFFLLFVGCAAALGKDKKQVLLPADILQAHTVMVVIDPEAGIAVDAPNANRTAREDVEKALMKWGRFSMAVDLGHADLVIMVRKGYGKAVQPTIGGIPNNDRPVIFQPTDSGGRIGMSRGSAPGTSASQAPTPRPQMEVGDAEDVFAVYRGGRLDATDASAVWRYSTKNALQSPGVPAVDVFRKLVAETEKQLQSANP